MNECCVCGTSLDGTGWLCHGCAMETTRYELDVPLGSLSTADWPEWAQYLLNEEQNERRYRARFAGGGVWA